MNENYEAEAAHAESEPLRELPSKWLRFLFYTQAASLAVLIFSAVTGLSAAAAWVGRAVTVGVIVCLFQLFPVNGRYRRSAFFRCAALGCVLLNILLDTVIARLDSWRFLGTVLTLTGSVCFIIAAYQEYHAHCDVAATPDQKLSGHWRSLFTWQAAVTVIAVLGSMMAEWLVVFLPIETAILTFVISVMLTGMEILIQGIYLMYLNRIAHIFRYE